MQATVSQLMELRSVLVNPVLNQLSDWPSIRPGFVRLVMDAPKGEMWRECASALTCARPDRPLLRLGLLDILLVPPAIAPIPEYR
jgi:hypothetical protein